MPERDNDSSPYGTCEPGAFASRIIRLTRRIPDRWLYRRLAFTLRRLVTTRLAGRPLDVESMGARFRLYPFNNVCEKRILFTPQYFDPAERAALGAFVDRRIESGLEVTFVDIGANIGGYSLFVAARTKGRGRLLAIEPQPVVFDRLCFNIGANPGCGVKALSIAVADREGPLTLFLAARNKGESSVKVLGFDAGEGASVTVPAAPLNRILDSEGIDRIDAMKIDVEGAEDLVLLPFFRSAPPARWPALLILANRLDLWHSDLDALLAEHGYVLRSTSRLKRLYERPEEAAAGGAQAPFPEEASREAPAAGEQRMASR
ncbi:FkbM family methyltransferase [Blastochloris sulfoviridis]|uniref:FkbM family methyltransferase n=1 Tax=Blastochloris sulfoviridis TaxID=50712 RepID=A0A5M6I320_9HYPH|nr:FkbM family methyltransferase [Blastochloris sulfoviridis]KAA5602289.1 FkbM family methyltransferase [Blastochloris sulfoviridis]